MAIQNISFSVGGQKIKYSTFTRIVANSVNVVTATFSFTQEWENYIKKAIFSIGDISKTLILTENTVEIPSECLTLGTLCVSVVGVIDEPYSRLTTEKMHGIPVIGSGALNGDTVNVPTPTEGEQVVLLAQSAVDTVDSALSVANGIDAKATQALSTANGIDAKATQALADAQAAINAVNAPDFSTTTLTALSQIATVTDSYSGVAEFTASGNTMQQVLVNGDFAQGTTGWTADSASISAANKILTITGNGLSAFPQAGKTEARIIVNGKYFIKGRCRLNTAYAGTAFLAVQIKGTTGGSFVQKIQDPIVGTWYDIYAIADASTFSGNIRVILYGQFADAATANGKVIEVDGNVGVFAIPTTGTPFENKATSEINANISEYWGGLKSVEKVEVVSRGRNLFDGVLEVGSISSTTGLPTVFASKSRSANFIRLKPSTAYKISITTGETFDLALWYYDHNKKFISYVDPYGLPVFTTPSNCEFMKFVNHSTDSPSYSIQLNEGSTALSYEEYKGSTASIQCTDNTKFDLAKLPNGVENTVEFKDGRYRAIKRVERYVLPSSYFYSISTGGTITDAVLVTKPTGDKLIDITSRAILSFQFEGFETYNVLTMDSDIAIGKACNVSTLKYGLIVPKGTYADIVAARTALAGTVIYYELATPVTIDEEDFADYGISIEGVLTSNNEYTEFYTGNYNIFSPISIEYAANLAKAVENLKGGMISLKEFQMMQNLINLEFDARIAVLEP